MKTRDGADFHLGMTLVTAGGSRILTNPTDFAVVDVNGVPCLERAGSHAAFDLQMFFSSEAARVEAVVVGIDRAIIRLSELRRSVAASPEDLLCIHCGERRDDWDGGRECPYCGKFASNPIELHLI